MENLPNSSCTRRALLARPTRVFLTSRHGVELDERNLERFLNERRELDEGSTRLDLRLQDEDNDGTCS